MSGLALFAGTGGLPAALVRALGDEAPLICALDGFPPEGVKPEITFRIERLVPFLDALSERGVTRLCLAGAVRRPRLDPALFDPATAQMVPRLVGAMQQGDDATLRAITGIFEEAGIAVVGVEDIAPGLLPGPGVLAGHVTPADEADADRAAAIVAALGAADVGQGCVVARGLCLAVEALPGTDAMLAQVAGLTGDLRPAKGLFYKAPKPGQDRRVDLPALGVQTVINAAAAGLAGIAFQAGGVICLDLPAMQAEAAARGLFLWAR